jgi:hypothetical protein
VKQLYASIMRCRKVVEREVELMCRGELQTAASDLRKQQFARRVNITTQKVMVFSSICKGQH